MDTIIRAAEKAAFLFACCAVVFGAFILFLCLLAAGFNAFAWLSEWSAEFMAWIAGALPWPEGR